MKEIKVDIGESLDSVIKKLIKDKEKGIKSFCNFNGVVLYSEDITVDSAYQAVVNSAKAEYDERVEREIEFIRTSTEKEREEARNDIPAIIERGQQLIYPFRYEEWEKHVIADVEGDYVGGLTKDALAIMEGIEEGKTVEELVELFKSQGHSGHSEAITKRLVLFFSKNGFPFYKAVHYGKWSKEETDAINALLKENEEYEASVNKNGKSSAR